MFKENRKYIYIFFGLFAVIIITQYLLPKPLNWNRTYLSKDKAPFGANAIYQLLQGVYSQSVSVNNQTFFNLKEKLDGKASVLLINDRFDLNKNDVKSLFTILDQGNRVFMAANSFDGPLTDTFHIKTHFEAFRFITSLDSLFKKPGEQIRMVAANQKNRYSYTQAAWVASFTNFDSTRFKVLAVTGKNSACLIRARVGKGELYLMTVPDIFTNYFIVKNHNRELAYTMLTLLKNTNLVWDEYYKTFNVTHYSFMKFILENDALYSAYILLLLTLIFYMITEGRRRQRSIPEMEPVNNTTLEFVNVISHVYFNSKNHKSIALEKIRYFYETVRKKFNVSTEPVDEAFVNEITELSGIDRKQVKQLFVYCEKIKTLEEISERDLLELNRQISNFNKNSLR